MGSLAIKDLIDHGGERLDLRLVAGNSGTYKELHDLSVRIFSKDARAAEAIREPCEILIIAHEELHWLATVSSDVRQEVLQGIVSLSPSLIICSKAPVIPEDLITVSERESIPLLVSDIDIFLLESRLIGLLREKIHNIVVINGVLVEVFGIGVVIIGDSGIGKSECGLELVTRGHKLIADDVIEVHSRNEEVLTGRSLDLTKYFMEIRGLGVINIKSLFGVAAVSEAADMSIMVEFITWGTGTEFDRMVSEKRYRTILGRNIPLIRAPVRSGGSMATVVEIVARNEILKRDNYDAVKDLKERVFNQIHERKKKLNR